MASFFIYDLSFLIVFSLAIALFLYARRRNLKREGIMFLYRTQLGVRAINYIGDKFKKTLHALKYLIIATGFVLMSVMIYLLGNVLYIYLKFPQITQIIKAPPLMPLIPYFPKIFGVQSLFPPFYFTYFLLALIIVAFVHEFAHGIYMRLFKIKIKSTGFVFLGPILGAFVEQDEKQMDSKPAVEQMSILGAGTFANIIFALLFFCLLILFFQYSFVESGYVFNSYAYSIIPMSSISGIGNLSDNLTEVYVGDEIYFLDDELKTQLDKNVNQLAAYDDAPAFRAGLRGAIIQIDNTKIRNQKDLENFLINKKPGDKIKIITYADRAKEEYEIILGENPMNDSKGYIGIAFVQGQARGFVSKFTFFIMNFKEPSTYYEPKWDGEFVYFIHDFLWWVAIINLFVALFNMLPLGILDGGKFFYLTVKGITKSERFAKGAFKFVTYLIGFLFLMMVIAWLFAL